MKLLKRQCRTEVRKNFFAFRTVNIWNRLPEELVTASSLNCFKIGLDLHGVISNFRHAGNSFFNRDKFDLF